VTSDNRIGTLSSSRRYKDEITPMEKASEAIHSLRPVSFRYKKEVDSRRSLSFGLIAEEVANVDPNLVTSDREGNPQTVRYEAINAMLLNEFLKDHRKVEEQQATISELKSVIQGQKNEFQAAIAEQRKEIEARFKLQDAKIQTVSDQIQLNRAAPEMAANNQ
jgi:hypothetical protein